MGETMRAIDECENTADELVITHIANLSATTRISLGIANPQDYRTAAAYMRARQA